MYCDECQVRTCVIGESKKPVIYCALCGRKFTAAVQKSTFKEILIVSVYDLITLLGIPAFLLILGLRGFPIYLALGLSALYLMTIKKQWFLN